MTALVIAAAVVLVVVGALAASDQMIARRAEHFASLWLTRPLGGPAKIRIHGEPFLTQAMRGRYRNVEVSGRELQIGEIAGADLSARLTNVLLPLAALLGRRVSELPCEHVEGTLHLPYAEVARLTRMPTLLLSHDGRRLIASVSLPIPGISSLARVSGEARLSVTEGGGIWLGVRGLTVAGITVPGIVLSQLVPSLSMPIPLPPLPYGLRIDGVDPTVQGLALHGSANAVVFRSTAAAPERP